MTATSLDQRAERRAARKVVNHETKRRQILDAAGELFFEKGYSTSSIDKIAAKLGVGKPFIYYYFDDKLAIFEALCLESSALTSKSFRDVKKKGSSASEKLRIGLHELITRYTRTFAGGALYYKEGGHFSEPGRAMGRRNALKLHSDIKKILEEGRATGEFEFEDAKLTALLIGGAIGFMYTWYDPNGKMTPEDLASLMVHEILKMVLPVARRNAVKP